MSDSQESAKRPETLRTRFLRWELGAILLGMVIIIAAAGLLRRESLLAYGPYLVVGVFILLAMILMGLWIYRWRVLKIQLQDTEKDLDATQRRLAAIFRLSHQFAGARDQRQVIALALDTCLEISPSVAASFVPLDEYELSLPAVTAGDLPAQSLKAWAEHLARPSIRNECSSCQAHAASAEAACPLLEAPIRKDISIQCVPVRSGDQDLGMLNLYYEISSEPDSEAYAFIAALADEMALALETLRLRAREAKTFDQLKNLHQDDQTHFLPALLQALRTALDGDFAYLRTVKSQSCSVPASLVSGQVPPAVQRSLDGVMRDVIRQKETVLLTEKSRQSELNGHIPSIVASPLLLPDNTATGAVIVGAFKETAFSSWAINSAQTVAAQMALYVQYANLMHELEYRTLINERRRLAREIHDGLAQTLGYLKLMSAQMASFMERGDSERLDKAVGQMEIILAGAYQDVREAIDGLRLSPEMGLEDWILHTSEDFQQTFGLEVEVAIKADPCQLAPEVQAQVVRIMQEALHNVRKHSGASQVWIRVEDSPGGLYIEVDDNGRGFEAVDLVGNSQYGMQSIRERAELIGAELLIKSDPQQGTRIGVDVPLPDQIATAGD